MRSTILSRIKIKSARHAALSLSVSPSLSRTTRNSPNAANKLCTYCNNATVPNNATNFVRKQCPQNVNANVGTGISDYLEIFTHEFLIHFAQLSPT